MADDPQSEPQVIPPTPAENTSPTSRLVEGREVDPAVLEGDIDQRMDALLKDHQEMGARPLVEPDNGDNATPDAPAEPTEEPKPKAAKKKATAKKK